MEGQAYFARAISYTSKMLIKLTTGDVNKYVGMNVFFVCMYVCFYVCMYVCMYV